MTFDEVLPALGRCCERHAAAIDCFYVVRDARGKIRLCVKLKDPLDADVVGRLDTDLQRDLGAFFASPILYPGEGDQAVLARGLIARAQEMGFEPWTPTARAQGRYRKLERRISKVEWLDQAPLSPPWAAGEGPHLIAFYSFKGGLGRSTALLSCAWQLAAQQREVAVVDLDLEAPGLGSLFLAEADQPTMGGRGVLDFLVDHVATGRAVADGIGVPASALAAEAERVLVYPAGSLTDQYLEKLARLDFLAGQDHRGSPAAKALELLLRKVAHPAARSRPEFILLDSRAGFHDLAGLSLHGLSHMDVLVGRASHQSQQGLDLTLGSLARHRGVDLSCVIVHAMAPVEVRDPVQYPDSEEGRFLSHSYSLFKRCIYSRLQNQSTPRMDDSAAPHFPVPLHFIEKLQRFVQTEQVRYELFGPDYQRLLSAILEKLPGGGLPQQGAP